jgi:Zn ribbon nucleic-acid-binding protein
MLLLKCPKCGHKMRCSPKGSISGKKKRCVYCGKAFKIDGNIAKEIIEEKKEQEE